MEDANAYLISESGRSGLEYVNDGDKDANWRRYREMKVGDGEIWKDTAIRSADLPAKVMQTLTKVGPPMKNNKSPFH